MGIGELPSIYSNNNGLLKHYHVGTPVKISSLLLVLMILSPFCHPNINALQSSKPAVVPVKLTSQILSQITAMCLQQESQMSKADTNNATIDFGNITLYDPPLATVFPSSVSQISCILKLVYDAAGEGAGAGAGLPPLTVAARGNAHSLHGQAQAPGGIVIFMDALSAQQPITVFAAGDDPPYVDVGGGHLWVNVLSETLKYGLSPKSWTDYLYLTVGGTLSNAGISGQAFRQGPQISNVDQLEVVTGKGEVFNCSEKENSDIFYGVLGGLGQFGIITRARIPLAPAPKMVKRIQAFYSDFATFSKDQEHLISLMGDSFDYIEGFVVINKTQQRRATYSIEAVKYFNPEDQTKTDEIISSLLSPLKYNQATLTVTELPYFEFLDRVHADELALRASGRWEVPHPWLNLFVPRSKIQLLADRVFGKIVRDSSSGPIIVYPLNKSKWNEKMSAVIPDEAVFYAVSILLAAQPLTAAKNSVEQILAQNRKILNFCRTAKLGVKQYLGYHKTMAEWRAHFGSGWDNFQELKTTYDPFSILGPGQRIFRPRTTMALT